MSARRLVCLGIDPGLASLGWGVVARDGSALRHVLDGTLHTKSDEGSDEARAVRLGREVRALIDAAKPDVVALERWVFYPEAEPHQSHALGLVIGAVLAQVDPSTPLVLLRAVETRSAIGLSKSATKDDVSRRVEALLRVRGGSQHARDALAIALVGLNRTPAANYQERLAR